MSIPILGTTISTKSKHEILESIKSCFAKPGQQYICTVNPEMLLYGWKHSFYKKILNASIINTCDGTGALIASGFTCSKYPGVDMMQDICALAQSNNHSIYLLGSHNDTVLQTLVQTLTTTYPTLRIVGKHIGPNMTVDKKTLIIDTNEEVIDDIIDCAPDILFVAFGFPKQEMWINTYLSSIPSVKLAIGVGGSFDYLSGAVSRAPIYIQQVGLEWLYRVIKQPKRIMRIIKAILLFPIVVIYTKLLSYVK